MLQVSVISASLAGISRQNPGQKSDLLKTQTELIGESIFRQCGSDANSFALSEEDSPLLDRRDALDRFTSGVNHKFTRV